MPTTSTSGLAVLAAVALAGCATVVSPVPPVAPPVYFPGAAPPPAAVVTAAPSETCTSGVEAGCFYRGMGDMLQAIERRRLEYLGLARSSVNDSAAYNALLYPAGALVLYRRMRGLPHSGLLAPAAIAAAAYGVISAGVPEVHKHYLRAAHELQCTQMRHAAWLYREEEIVAPQPVAARDAALETLINQLELAVDFFADARSRASTGLAAPRAPAGPADAFERARGTGGGTRRKDQRPALMQRSGDQLHIAAATLAQLRTLKRRIDRAPWSLQQEWNDVERDVQSGLSDRLPPPRDPQVVASALKGQLAKANSGASESASMDTALPVDLLDGVVDDAKGTLIADLRDTGARLQKHWLKAKRFLEEHQQREAQAATELVALQCSTRSPAVPPPPAAGDDAAEKKEPLPKGNPS